MPGGHPRRDSNGSAWRKARARVLASGDHCVLCHRTVIKGGDPLHPDAAQADHIVPVSLGGHPTALDNLQLTCRRCNRRKGNGGRSPAEALVGPPWLSERW